MILVYIPCAGEEEAAEMAKHLLDKSFIGCANIVPCRSFYKEEGDIKESTECLLIVKTTKALAGFLRAEVERIHSYETPAIVEVEARVNKKYDEWLLSELQEV